MTLNQPSRSNYLAFAASHIVVYKLLVKMEFVQNMQQQNVLVTGGAGYIGSHACKALLRAGYTPVVYDNLSRGFQELVKFGPFVEGDLHDSQSLRNVIAKYKPIGCIHFAAFAYVGESVANPSLYYRNNVLGSLNLLDALVATGVKKIVFSSTCATYGQPDVDFISESTPQKPMNPYGHSKLMVEQLLKDFDMAHELKSVALRYFNACGADVDGEIGEMHDPEPHLIPRIIMAAMSQISHIDVMGTDYDTPDGTAIRDYIHVEDLADAHVAALKYLLENNPSDVFNLGTGKGHSVKEVIAAIERASNLKVPVNNVPRRAGDPAQLVADNRKAKEILGFEPKYLDIEKAVRTALRWHQRNV
jgi:UDP-arabinose 4-epimerase